jgi:hypothetical protein
MSTTEGAAADSKVRATIIHDRSAEEKKPRVFIKVTPHNISRAAEQNGLFVKISCFEKRGGLPLPLLFAPA